MSKKNKGTKKQRNQARANKPALNSNNKDRLFKKLFGSPENKSNMLALYNALNGTSYTDEAELELYTIDDVIYMGMKNDAAYILDSYIVLNEHQSTYNPNMPLRGLLYYAKLYEKYIVQNKIDIYSTALKKIPTPQFYVFYNGNTVKEDRITLKLSDSFIQPVREGEFEWTAIMLNINKGHNEELLQKCQTLGEYAALVDKIKEGIHSGLETREAVISAVDWAIANNILSTYLKMHKSEVIGMVLTEYNEKEVMEDLKNEAYNNGYGNGYDSGYGNGYEQGTKTLNTLHSLLIKSNRWDDLSRATVDPQFQAQLIKELLPEFSKENIASPKA